MSISKVLQCYLLFKVTVLNHIVILVKYNMIYKPTNSSLTPSSRPIRTCLLEPEPTPDSPVSQTSRSAAGRLLCDCCTSKQLSLTPACSVIKVSLLLRRRPGEETVKLECVKSACINVLALHNHREHFNELHRMFPSNSTMVYVADSRPRSALPLPASALD